MGTPPPCRLYWTAHRTWLLRDFGGKSWHIFWSLNTTFELLRDFGGKSWHIFWSLNTTFELLRDFGGKSWHIFWSLNTTFDYVRLLLKTPRDSLDQGFIFGRESSVREVATDLPCPQGMMYHSFTFMTNRL
jgi:hypothetical protein